MEQTLEAHGMNRGKPPTKCESAECAVFLDASGPLDQTACLHSPDDGHFGYKGVYAIAAR